MTFNEEELNDYLDEIDCPEMSKEEQQQLITEGIKNKDIS